jgi:hypothetical protein
MNKAILLGGLFLRVTSVYAAATHGDLIAEGRRRNEEAYERTLEQTGWKTEPSSQEQKASAPADGQKASTTTKPKSS